MDIYMECGNVQMAERERKERNDKIVKMKKKEAPIWDTLMKMQKHITWD